MTLASWLALPAGGHGHRGGASRWLNHRPLPRAPLRAKRHGMRGHWTLGLGRVHPARIYLTREETTALDRMAAERGVTPCHLIREAIESTYVTPERSQRDQLLAVLEELGPPWANRADLPDGETYVERIRAGLPVSVEPASPPRSALTESSAQPKR